MPTVKMLSLVGESLTPPPFHPPSPPLKKKKVLDHDLHHDLVTLPLLWCLFAHLLILEYSDHHQNLITSSLYYPGPFHKISLQSVHNFLSYVVHRQTALTNSTKDTRSTQREQTSLAEADHYSHMPTVKMLSLLGESLTPPPFTTPLPPPKKKRSFGSLPAPRSSYATAIMVFCLLIYSFWNTQITTKNLITASLYYPVTLP